jgi:phage gp36-like protein
VGLDRSYTESRVRIPLKAWMFVLVFLCCAVLSR